ncbi:hypothetical protein Pmar_PMAR010212 [Perkinsus marinus ATCC 50983]|uniref:Uncharacterized protein n=1 Tax=Perkinsus marinus (strain ATCC 50983 / TXsc) TaxID=423536 RepID=C5K547_PERM5|nr:hypothetical protein Pmar_PMAR010212 [Perkinsus marinus ATCC 50983]EER20469.1 hypothetical protein Pmar_PMAR010212 [Perkinsus marinus ATCC 50983]|eukprot:XP_002788673.1 hypothetical protein Pmar_PMAR010212 [Perkinsus marinus ATCC 50983]
MVSEEGADSCTMALGSDSVIGAGLFDLKALSAKISGEYGPLALPDGRAVYFDAMAGRADITKTVVAGKCAASTMAEEGPDRVPIGTTITEVRAASHGLGLLLVAPAEVGACQNIAVIDLICDPSVGICSGQYVAIEWHLAEACRLCSTEDYVRTVSECINGTQETVYAWYATAILPASHPSTVKAEDYPGEH